MSDVCRILVCDQAQSAHWQLRGPSAASHVLIGWTVARKEHRDAGVPSSVASLLANALTSFHHCGFFSTRESWTAGHPRIVALESNLLGSTPPRSSFVVTCNPAILRESFDDDGFPWPMQGQLLLLGDSRLEQLDPRTAKALLQSPASFHLDTLETAGVQLLLSPGVDGDVLALFARSAEKYRPLLSALQAQAAANGFEYRSVDEEEFAQALAD